MPQSLTNNLNRQPPDSSDDELRRFANLFRSETVLRSKIVSVLRKMGKVGVRLHHGSAERGKDILFYAPGGLNEERLYACVVKWKRITGTVSSLGAREVLHQASMCLDTSVPNSQTGIPEKVDGVYIMCPHPCSPDTMDSISGALKEKDIKVTFWCGEALLRLFTDYWPDFFALDQNWLRLYMVAAEKQVADDAALTNLLFANGLLAQESKNLSDVYVKPQFHRTLILHDCLLKVPEIRALQGEVSLGYINGSLIPQLRSLVVVARATALDPDLAARLDSVGGAISLEWNKAYNRRFSGRPDDLHQKLETKLVLPTRFVKNITQTLNTAQSLASRLRRYTAIANNLASDRASTDLEILDSSSYITYCDVATWSMRAPSIIKKKELSQPRTLSFPDFLLDQFTGPLLITASAGVGKTSFCRWNVLQDIKRLLDRRSRLLPIYIQLHQLSQRRLIDFDSAFFSGAELKKLLTENYRKKESDRYAIRLYLDGLDEVSSLQKQMEIVELVKNQWFAHKNLQVVFTARDHVYGPWLDWLPRIHISGLDTNGTRQLAHNWLSNDEEVDQFFTTLRQTAPMVAPLLSIPLLGTLILAIYRHGRMIPPDRLRLYEMFISLLSGGWDIAKNVRREGKFDRDRKLIVLVRLAGIMHLARKRDFDAHMFANAVREVQPKLRTRMADLLDEIARDGLITAAGTKFTFSHLSFQEFLAARDLAEPTGRSATRVLLRFCSGDDWWKDVLTFYIAMMTRPSLVEAWLWDNLTTNSEQDLRKSEFCLIN